MTVSVSGNWLAYMEEIARQLDDQGFDISAAEVQKQPIAEFQVRPGLYVTPTDKKYGKQTNERDDIGYGCQVTFIRGSLNEFSASPEEITEWAETASRLFHYKRLCDTNVRDDDAILPCVVEGAPAEWDELPETGKKIDGTAFVVRAWVRESRQ